MNRQVYRNSRGGYLVVFCPHSREDKKARQEFDRNQRKLAVMAIRLVVSAFRNHKPKTVKDVVCVLRDCCQKLSEGVLLHKN